MHHAQIFYIIFRFLWFNVYTALNNYTHFIRGSSKGKKQNCKLFSYFLLFEIMTEFSFNECFYGKCIMPKIEYLHMYLCNVYIVHLCSVQYIAVYCESWWLPLTIRRPEASWECGSVGVMDIQTAILLIEPKLLLLLCVWWLWNECRDPAGCQRQLQCFISVLVCMCDPIIQEYWDFFHGH